MDCLPRPCGAAAASCPNPSFGPLGEDGHSVWTAKSLSPPRPRHAPPGAIACAAARWTPAGRLHPIPEEDGQVPFLAGELRRLGLAGLERRPAAAGPVSPHGPL